MKYIPPFIYLLISCLTTMVQAQSSATIEQRIQNILTAHEGIGLSVAVVKEGDVIFSKAFGYQNLENKKPLSEKHVFRIASISKSFSATAIMQLVEAGKLSLDDDFSDLIGFKVRNPKFPDDVITLRMVLSHTSSISDRQGYFRLDPINPDKNQDWEKCYNDYKPGTDYQYCNLNYNMVGAVIERFSNERFDQYIVNHILNPLGLYGGYYIGALDSSLFANLYEYNRDNTTYQLANAYSYRPEVFENYTLGYSTPLFSPTGGMKISAEDLAKYMIMHMNYGQRNGIRIISEESAREMQQPLLEKGRYGLGLNNRDNYIPGKAMIGHTGDAYGLYSNMYFSPEEKFGMVIITNGTKSSYKDGYIEMLHQAAQALYQHFIE